MDLHEQTALQLKQRILTHEVSAREVTQAFVDAAAAREPLVRAYLTVDEPGALTQADEVDRKIAAGEPVGPLAGVPVAVKDVLCTRGQRTTCGSRILANFIPPYDAFAVAKLRAADAVILGKTNMDEFAMGSSCENSGFQVTRNPWDLDCIPGGSSGGSAAAVAACCAPLALGSDTGGSIRQPAALCGITGLKPTYGRVSRYGLVAFASSLDQVGPMAHDVSDVALLLGVIAGHDPQDSTSVDRAVPDYLGTVDDPIEGLTIGLVKEHYGEGLDPEVEHAVHNAVGVYQKRGATVKEVSLPTSDYGIAAYYIVATGEASSNLARYDGVHYGHRAATFDDMIDMYSKTRAEGFGPEVKRRIMLGTHVLSSGYYEAYYAKALKVRRLIKQELDRAFDEVDVIVGPTTPTPAFRIGEKVDDPLAMYLSDIYTITCNLAGIAGISVPCGFSDAGLPIGLQVLARPFDEARLLRVARLFERETEYHLRRVTM